MNLSQRDKPRHRSPLAHLPDAVRAHDGGRRDALTVVVRAQNGGGAGRCGGGKGRDSSRAEQELGCDEAGGKAAGERRRRLVRDAGGG